MKTLEDIAKISGVSKSTVHRVVSGGGDVSVPTVDRVLRIAKEIGYKPRLNSRKKNGTKGVNDHSSIFGVIFYDTRKSIALTANLLYSFHNKFSSSNSTMFMAEYDGTGRLPEFVQNGTVNGLIIRPGTHFERIYSKIPANMPAVWLFEDTREFLRKGYDSVLPNDVQVADLACRYFKNSGCERIAAINVFPGHRASSVRLRNIQEFGKADFQACYAVEQERSEEDIIQELFLADPYISGLYISGGTPEVMKAYMSLLKIEKKPCEDVKLAVCTEDISTINKIDERICKINICADEIVNTAVDTLNWRINNPDRCRRIIYIEPKLY
jgi:DNA-binding LacI/PurR family transcriptional regulator